MRLSIHPAFHGSLQNIDWWCMRLKHHGNPQRRDTCQAVNVPGEEQMRPGLLANEESHIPGKLEIPKELPETRTLASNDGEIWSNAIVSEYIPYGRFSVFGHQLHAVAVLRQGLAHPHHMDAVGGTRGYIRRRKVTNVHVMVCHLPSK